MQFFALFLNYEKKQSDDVYLAKLFPWGGVALSGDMEGLIDFIDSLINK